MKSEVPSSVPIAFHEMKTKTQLSLEQEPKKKRLTLAELKSEIMMNEHLLTVDDLSKKMESSNIDPNHPENSKGLSSIEAKHLLEVHGKNQLMPKSVSPWILRFLKHFTNLFCILLASAGVLCIIAFVIAAVSHNASEGPLDFGNLYLGIALFLVVLISAGFTFYQEEKSSAIMSTFKKLVPHKTTVIRDGNQTQIDPIDLVVGDVVKINAGDKIPADIRLIFQKDLLVNNSSLTGESELVQCHVESTHNNPLESRNIIFFGTYAESGMGYGVVIYAGDNTMMGRIATLTEESTTEMTPLHKELNRFISTIFGFAIVLGTIIFIVSFVLYPTYYISNIVITIGILVAIVPEGLLATVTLCLTLTAKRMANKNVLVKNLESVETLGSTTTIASDKTGTLTQNRMTVSHVWYDDTIYECSTLRDQPHTFPMDENSFQMLLNCAGLCNNASFDLDPVNMLLSILDRKTIGDASESALLKFVESITSINKMRENHLKLSEIPFSSLTKWQMSIHKWDQKNHMMFLKGAPERVIDFSSKIGYDGNMFDLNEEWKKKYSYAYETLGSYGERVFGFAYCPVSLEGVSPDQTFDLSKMNFKNKPFIFLGLLSMIDPPREGVLESIKKCKEAGIRVIMVTGDHPITAQAIAKKVGIIESDSYTIDEIAEQFGVLHRTIPPERATCEIVHGEIISRLTQNDWDRILDKKEIVFARTSPQQKLIIVEKCQERKEVVAVTGDGVNDSPALKKANIGVAMGSGTDVAKEAADLILLDDNFSSIVNAVEEGRLIFDNLKKSIAFIITHNIPELIPFIAFLVLGIPLPIGTLLILSIDLIVDIVPSICFAYEEAEAGLMKRKPRSRKERMASSRLFGFSFFQIGVVESMAGFFSYLVVLMYYGFTPSSLLYVTLPPHNHFLPFNSRPITNAYGQVFSHQEQIVILRQAQTSFFFAIFVCQQANALVCKTRYTSFFNHKVNWYLLLGRLFSFGAVLFIIYCPWVNWNIFQAYPISPLFWLPAIPFFIFIIFYDEIRKLLIRKMKGTWVEKYTIW